MGCGVNRGDGVDETLRKDDGISANEKLRLNTVTSKANIRDIYNFHRVLGSGGFGIVKLATFKSNPSKQIAVKFIEKAKLKNK